MSVGSGVIVIFAVWAHLTASARFRARAQGPVSGQLATTISWRTDQPRWFPAAFRPPAFASRSSCSRRGVGPSSRSADRTRPRACPDPDGVTPFRTHELRPGRAPSIPRGQRCSPRPRRLPAGRPPLRNGLVPAPRHTSHRRGSRLTRQTRVHKCSPVRSSPRLWPPGWNGPPLGSPPGLRTPPTRSRTTHARVGTGHRARTWDYTLNSHSSISNPVVHSLCATSGRTSPRRSPDLWAPDDEGDRARDACLPRNESRYRFTAAPRAITRACLGVSGRCPFGPHAQGLLAPTLRASHLSRPRLKRRPSSNFHHCTT